MAGLLKEEPYRYRTEAFFTMKGADGADVVTWMSIATRTKRALATVRGASRRMGFNDQGLLFGQGRGVTQEQALAIVEKLKVTPEKNTVRQAVPPTPPPPMPPPVQKTGQSARAFKRPHNPPVFAAQPPGLDVKAKPESKGFNPPPPSVSDDGIAQAINRLKEACKREGFKLSKINIEVDREGA